MSPPPSRRPADRAGPEPSRHFAVVVHDVAPAHRPALGAIVAALAPLVGDRLMGAVVPCWHGHPAELVAPGPAGSELRRFIRDHFGEVLQHGGTHRGRRLGAIALLTGGSDELAGLSVEETRRRLRWGRAVLAGLGDRPVAGFVPPAWQAGRVSLGELARLGYRYRADWAAVRFVDARPVPLVTWSWDWGVVGPLGRWAEAGASAQRRLRPDALPCVVAHPADVGRGYLPRIARVVARLRGEGRSPLLFKDLAAPALVGASS